jgi:hypothetical protein
MGQRRRRTLYVIDLYQGQLVATRSSEPAANRAAEAHVRRTGNTCGVAELLTGFQAE